MSTALFSIVVRRPDGSTRTTVTSDNRMDEQFMVDTADEMVRLGGVTEAKVYDHKGKMIAVVDESFFAHDYN